ncbi:MAG: acyl-CoA thioesterase [Elusimicrobia bacterium]|nr:acyl-CoA thioesterase [Elusimicrobiota bacterium]
MSEYRISVELPVRFSDTDAMGHANNARYLSYLEEARFKYAKDVLGISDWRVSFILARVEIDYRSPAFCGETVVVAMRVSKIGGASFEATYRLTDKASGRLVAEAKTVQVWFDYPNNKVIRVPTDMAAKLRAFDGVEA